MDALTASMVVLMLIFGFGLAGASYSQCSDTLSSNGYNLSDSQLQSFYEAANDPDNINYINNNSEFLSEQWSASNSSSGGLTGWFNDYLDDYSVLSTVDENFSWDSVEGASDVVVYGGESKYGINGKRITDGHGGYYESFLMSSNDADGHTVLDYYIYHYDTDGNISKVGSRSETLLGSTPEEAGPWGLYLVNFNFAVRELEGGSQEILLYHTNYLNHPFSEAGWYSVDNCDILYYNFDSTATETIEDITADISIPVNPDGSITLPDGSLVYPNSDGVYPIGGIDYTPVTDISGVNINDLLKRLLDLQQQVSDLKNELVFDQDNVITTDVSDAVDSAVGSYAGDLSEFLLNSRITQVFPFCLPFDFVRGLKLISADPVAPKFDIDFEIPSFGAYPGTHNVISLDLGVYSKYFTVVRWVTTILFIISLCFLTYKLIKW